ncbi:hypothetical protein N7509_000246 [Penicillium cosmopolitanum]|uniref:Killer toxin Kp4 domain-containing protein n=1 Tax=Penicillium cosmopolitanum TaxID=1131564 RepID=A0A9W9W0R2_9EURO|nr:uncharacterized protein N7509_006480 [Penicillium cosmopolitanum]XP_056493475.1 uncharacterized protein N7509_000246 [Penicillium cosmopolitanum]KAJ5394693.1 hypothetical protein N7509_006480 [Penicillium cosmopolitanum]KAJ5413619.1 hypothetical protein N7509_000246 [Penicillium cosmopolitanum]
MRYSLGLIPALALSVSALGINCQGSSQCGNVDGRSTDILASVQKIDPNRTYFNGQRIACWKAGAGDGLCAFLQGTGGIQGSLIPELVQDLVNHGCTRCGSVPVFFNSGDNNINDHGELTINYVLSTGGCNGLC